MKSFASAAAVPTLKLAVPSTPVASRTERAADGKTIQVVVAGAAGQSGCGPGGAE